MKLRIKFSKTGPVKFLGHLDVMRYFQKAVRRADIPVAYSEGFSPHQIMSFASPLGVGLESEGEYLDIELARPLKAEELRERLNGVMAGGIRILSVAELPEKEKNAMASVCAAAYRIRPKDNHAFPFGAARFQEQAEAFLAQEEILFLKKTKRSESETNIRPLIYSFEAEDKNADELLSIRLLVASGSAANLKPEPVLDLFCRFCGLLYEPAGFQTIRLDLYRADGEGRFISLGETVLPGISGESLEEQE